MSSLVAKCSYSLHLPSKSHAEHSSSIRSFDEALDTSLRPLLQTAGHGAPITLAWLSDALNLLTLTITRARPLISDLCLATSDTLDAHLDAGVPLLDACNAVSCEVAQLERRLLRLRLVSRLLSNREEDEDSPPRQLSKERLRRALKGITDWESNSGRRSAGEMIRRMAPEEPARGNVSAVRRATHTVEAVSHLVMAAAMVVLLGSGESNLLSEVAVSRRWPWAEAYNEVAAAVSGGAGVEPPGELEAVEASVRMLKAVMCGNEEEGDRTVRMRMAVEAVETAVEELTARLDELRESVNGAYQAAMATRNAALNRMRSRTRRCK